MKKSVPCIMCHGTDYADDCAGGQCHAEQLDLITATGTPPLTCENDSANCVLAANWRGVCLVHAHTSGWFQDEEMRRHSAELSARPTLPAGRHERGWPHG